MAKKKTIRKHAPRATKEAVEKRIEQCRMLLMRCRTNGDIKRIISKEYDIESRSVENYLSVARARNRETLEKDADQNLSESISDWSEMRQEYEGRIVMAKKRVMAAQISIERCDVVLGSDNATEAAKKRAVGEKSVSADIIKQSAAEIGNCRYGIKGIRCQLDKLLGNYAPVKHANTTKDGHDVDVPADSEPVTQEQEDAEWKQLLDTLDARGGDGASAMDKPKVQSGGNGRKNGKGK